VPQEAAPQDVQAVRSRARLEPAPRLPEAQPPDVEQLESQEFPPQALPALP
jgi:hypothetical protein